jgi:hypothetical protein
MADIENTSVETQVEETTTENTETETKTYTQEEVLALIQSESDKRVQQALKTQQKKYEKQLSLTKLDGEEREKAEKDNRIAELEEMVAQMNVEKNRSEIKSVLAARGLSAEFADIIVITDDIETSQENITKLDKLFKAAVKAEVEKRLAASGGAPKGGNSLDTNGEITKEQFKAMTLSQQAALARENKELYERLTK